MDGPREPETVILRVAGMTCSNCVRHVTGALTALQGVLEAEVDLEHGKATVRIEPGAVGREALAAAVNEAGYEAAIVEG